LLRDTLPTLRRGQLGTQLLVLAGEPGELLVHLVEEVVDLALEVAGAEAAGGAELPVLDLFGAQGHGLSSLLSCDGARSVLDEALEFPARRLTELTRLTGRRRFAARC
jgi:hypothetical protein